MVLWGYFSLLYILYDICILWCIKGCLKIIPCKMFINYWTEMTTQNLNSDKSRIFKVPSHWEKTRLSAFVSERKYKVKGPHGSTENVHYEWLFNYKTISFIIISYKTERKNGKTLYNSFELSKSNFKILRTSPDWSWMIL